MYTAENIIWIKNVKRNDGYEWAYENDCNKLNWSSRVNAGRARKGDIIILFQKPKFVNGLKNKDVFLTHLVSPKTDDDPIPDNNSIKHKWCREVEVIAYADPMFMIPKPNDLNFTTVNTGLSYLIKHIGNINLTESLLQDTIWNLFSPYLIKQDVEVLSDAAAADLIVGLLSLEDEALEGQLGLIEHIKKEVFIRNAVIVRKAKEEALRNGNGRILCECCKFDFLKIYGILGFEFIECHHKIAITKGERITRIKDLALVCSNCHSMLHRRNKYGHYYSVEELTLLIQEQKNII